MLFELDLVEAHPWNIRGDAHDAACGPGSWRVIFADRELQVAAGGQDTRIVPDRRDRGGSVFQVIRKVPYGDFTNVVIGQSAAFVNHEPHRRQPEVSLVRRQLHPDRAQLVAVGFAALLNLHRVTHVNLVAAVRVVIDKVKFVDTGPHRVIRRATTARSSVVKSSPEVTMSPEKEAKVTSVSRGSSGVGSSEPQADAAAASERAAGRARKRTEREEREERGQRREGEA
ncbi:MAG: hypothetical protein ACTH2K_03350 [Candidatus Corynebacterium faecigallinarum]|uniref:hypothetical protein n=1 Tax=Candidatus Corynebacterium faecigallinarum TaxID=2838528 RepID=UPI00264A5580|nr:hypothetical protein [Corynebacterium sp.]